MSEERFVQEYVIYNGILSEGSLEDTIAEAKTAFKAISTTCSSNINLFECANEDDCQTRGPQDL